MAGDHAISQDVAKEKDRGVCPLVMDERAAENRTINLQS